APVVLFAGKFEARKQPLQLLEAFAALDHPTAVLVLLGAGALEAQLRARAAQLAPGRVCFVGFQNQSAMPRAYALGDLLVLPSLGNGETWGLAVNEAMNLARPVLVSSHVGGAADLVLPGRTGWIVPAGDQAALRRALSEALSDPARLRDLGRAAQAHVAAFSYKAATAGLLKALEAVVPSAAAAPPPVVDVICPELYAREGGVQIYGRVLIEGLLQVLPQRVRLRVFVRNDRPRHRPALVDPRVELHLCGTSRAFASLGCTLLSQLGALVRQKPALLLSTHPNFAPIQWLLARLAGCPAWSSAHGIDVWELRPGPRRWALRRLDRLLPVSRHTRDQLRRQLEGQLGSPPGAPCPELAVLPNTYDERRFRPGPRPPELLQRYGLAPDQPLIFCLTRLSRHDRYKHVDALIEAMPPLLERFPDLRLLIGGTGDDRPRLQELARQRGLGEVVLLPGKLAAGELADHYRLASLFALPSEKEGFGIVFLEALGCGTPVLAGNRDGSLDPLDGGRFGCLVDPRLPLAPPLEALLEGQGEPLWHSPEALADEVAARFGFEAFCARLRQLLASVPALGVEA
ncbi:MAG: glycosyltransferase family 4 protein, partial [Prochlorococcaceae cyanobacterium]